MVYKITRYENYGKGFEKIFENNLDDASSKHFVKLLQYNGYKRIRGSGIVGLSYEGITEDKMGKVQITIERMED